MEPRIRQIVWMFLLMAGVVKPLLAGSMEAAPQFTVLVFDPNRLAEPEWADAERQATSIFRRAGVAVVWQNCSAGRETSCHQVPGPMELVVTIVAQSQQKQGEVFGAAFLDENGHGQYADIFFGNIAGLHRDAGFDKSRLLAAVTAHEIGHLLLGSHSHSAWGIMTRHWQAEHLKGLERGGLLFTPEQAARMQARLR